MSVFVTKPVTSRRRHRATREHGLAGHLARSTSSSSESASRSAPASSSSPGRRRAFEPALPSRSPSLSRRVVCGLAALCYAEFASTVPVAGSAYTFSYASLGELVAWIIGWDLVLELALGAARSLRAGPPISST